MTLERLELCRCVQRRPFACFLQNYTVRSKLMVATRPGPQAGLYRLQCFAMSAIRIHGGPAESHSRCGKGNPERSPGYS